MQVLWDSIRVINMGEIKNFKYIIKIVETIESTDFKI